MTFCRDQSCADCKSGCLQCILWCSIQQVPLGWTVLLWTSIFRVRPSQISINFIAIPDIGYLERDGLGQTGWMGKCKNAIGSFWKGLNQTESGSLLQVEYSPLRLVRNLKKTKSFYTLKAPQKAENDRSTPKSISTKGKNKFKGGEDLLDFLGRCRYWDLGWHWKSVFYEKQLFIQCFSIVGRPSDRPTDKKSNPIPSWLEE